MAGHTDAPSTPEHSDQRPLAPSFSSVRNALTMPFDTVDSSNRGLLLATTSPPTWSRPESPRDNIRKSAPCALTDENVLLYLPNP
jgi:hypothetical protein